MDKGLGRGIAERSLVLLGHSDVFTPQALLPPFCSHFLAPLETHSFTRWNHWESKHLDLIFSAASTPEDLRQASTHGCSSFLIAGGTTLFPPSGFFIQNRLVFNSPLVSQSPQGHPLHWQMTVNGTDPSHKKTNTSLMFLNWMQVIFYGKLVAWRNQLQAGETSLKQISRDTKQLIRWHLAGSRVAVKLLWLSYLFSSCSISGAPYKSGV